MYASVGIAGAAAAIHGLLTVGQLTSFLNYANQYTKPFNEISGVLTELQNAVASAARVFALIDEEPQDVYKRQLLYCILYSITPLLIGVFGVIIAFRMLNRISLENIFTNVLSELKSGWYIFTTSLSSKVFSAIGVTILGIVSTKENVGVYSALQKIPTALLLMWIPVSQV